MPDLSPDLSSYRAIAAEGQRNQLDLGGLINIARAARELQTQGAMSDALKSSVDPNTGQVDYGAALGKFIRGGGYATPENTASFAMAGSHVTSAIMDQTRKAGDFIAYHADDPDLDHDKAVRIIQQTARAGVPSQVVANVISTLPTPTGDKTADRKALSKALVEWQNTLTQGQPPGFGELPGRAGGGIPQSPASAAFVGRGLAPPPGTQGAIEGAIPGAGGLPSTKAPTGMGGTLEASAKASQEVLQSVDDLPNQYTNLENLRSLSQEAISGPQTGFEERLNQLGQRFGVNLTASAGKLAATEDYAKAAELLVQNSPAYGHSNAFLNNAYGTIPAKELSKLGREGITDWLLGNTDAKAFMINKWQQWLATPGHEAYANQYTKWLNSKTMPDGSPGFDAANFDPRVFQYARMATYAKADDGTIINPRAEFTKRMSDEQVKKFRRNLEDYRANGWVNIQ